MLPACVSAIGSAVSEPPPRSGARLRRALEQPRMDVEDVAGIRLAPGGRRSSSEIWRYDRGVLGQVVDDQQHVAPAAP